MRLLEVKTHCLLVKFAGILILHVFIACMGAYPQSPTSILPGQEAELNYFGGQLRWVLPLRHQAGRGDSIVGVSAKIQRTLIRGGGQYHRDPSDPSDNFTESYSLKALYEDSYFNSPKWHREYYDELNEHGAGYGPGAVYVQWYSSHAYNRKADRQGNQITNSSIPDYVKHRAYSVIYVDAAGRKHELLDEQVISRGLCTTFCGYYGSSIYRNIHQAGLSFRNREDNRMIFQSDTYIAVPNYLPADNLTLWGQHSRRKQLGVPAALPSGYLDLGDGTRMRIDGGYITWQRDRNGNFIKFEYENIPPTNFTFDAYELPLKRVKRIIDSLERETTFQYDIPTATGTVDVISYKGIAGQQSNSKIYKELLQNALAYGDTTQSLRQLYDPSRHYQLQSLSYAIKHNPEVISRIEIGNQVFDFNYNAYGELSQVINPSGSQVSYVYGPPHGGYSVFSYNSVGTSTRTDEWFYYRRLTEVKTYNSESEIVSRTEIDDVPSGDNTIIEIKDFDNNGSLFKRTDKKYYGEFRKGDDSEWNVWRVGREFEELEYSTLNGVVSPSVKKENTWDHGPIGATPGIGDYAWWNGNASSITLRELPRVSVIRTSLLDVSPNLVSENQFAYDEFLNVTSNSKFDWGQGVKGPLISAVTTNFLKTNPITGINYANNGLGRLTSLPTRTTTLSRNSTPVSVTDYEYDNYSAGADNNHDPILTRQNIVNNCIPLDFAGQCTSSQPETFTARGNVTAITTYKDSVNRTSPVVTYNKYDVAGNVVSSINPLGKETKTEFNDAFADNLNRYTFAFPTRALSAIPDIDGVHGSQTALETSSSYDYETGLRVQTVDENASVTTYEYSDESNNPEPRNRVKKITRPDGGWTAYDYSDLPGQIYVRTRTLIQSAPTQVIKDEYQYYDERLRPTIAYSYEPSETPAWVAIKTSYNPAGKVQKISVPTRVNAPGDSIPLNTAGTSTQYDLLGRETVITGSDGAIVHSVYQGNKVMITDQAGKSRMIEKSAADNITKVVEYDRQIENPSMFSDPLAGDFETTYEYNAFNKITKVLQGVQTREFSFDALGRMISIKSPETGLTNSATGLTTFTYYDDGSLDTRTDGRGVITKHHYDGLGRIIKREYSLQGSVPTGYEPAPASFVYYDGKGIPSSLPTPNYAKGRATAAKSSVAETLYTDFDPMGRVIAHRQVTDPLNGSRREFSMEYAYNFAGSMTSQKYPSGKTVVNEYDNANRITGVREGHFFYAGNYASHFSRIKYTAHGDVRAIKLGNGLWHHQIYNSRQQTTEIRVGTAFGNSNLLKIEYTYGSMVGSQLDPLKNNGNAQSQKVTLPGGTVFTQSYVYDNLNRLKSVEENNQAGVTQLRQTFNIDRYGNRTFNLAETDPELVQQNIEINSAKNRIASAGYSYDGAGNMIQAPFESSTQSLVYDSENRLVRSSINQTSWTEYAYDGDGRRIRAIETSGQAPQTTIYVYNVTGQLVEEYVDQGESGKQIAYLTQDHLGSTRLVTNRDRAVLSRHDYLPYGEEITASLIGTVRDGIPEYNGGTVGQKFAGKERSLQTKLDYFGARYYASALGRFVSPDAPFADQHAQNPQSWNLYSYTRNNPIRVADKSGRWSPLDILDVVGVIVDAYQYFRDPSAANAAWLSASIAAAFLPEVPSLTTLRWVDEAADAARYASVAIAETTASYQEARFIATSIDNAVGGGNDASKLLGLADESFEGGKQFFEFYTIQNGDDAMRLTSSGAPWPDTAQRAHLGTGVYAWGTQAEALSYMTKLETSGAQGLEVLTFRVSDSAMESMRRIDVNSLGDPAAAQFMERYSRLWGGTPDHGFDLIMRGTAMGNEFFFSSSVYSSLNWAPRMP